MMNEITMCNIKGVTHKEEPTENYHSTLQFLSAPHSFIASFSSFIWLSSLQP